MYMGSLISFSFVPDLSSLSMRDIADFQVVQSFLTVSFSREALFSNHPGHNLGQFSLAIDHHRTLYFFVVFNAFAKTVVF